MIDFATARRMMVDSQLRPTDVTDLEVLGAMGYLPPMWAAFLHMIASAIVIFNSARLVRFDEHVQSTPTTTPTRPAPARPVGPAMQPVAAPV